MFRTTASVGRHKASAIGATAAGTEESVTAGAAPWHADSEDVVAQGGQQPLLQA